MLIGLAGYAGAGKDTVGKILVEQYDFKRVAFADKVKELALKLNPWVDIPSGDHVPLRYYVDAVGWDTAKKAGDVRELLQCIGQGARDILGEDVWIDATTRDGVYGERTVITDVRYPNELEYIRDMGGVVWWVDRPGVTPVNDHESENSVSPANADWFVINDRGVESLKAEVLHTLKQSY